MSHYDVTKSRIIQWLGIILIIAVFAGAYWYFQVRASTLSSTKVNTAPTNGLIAYWTFDRADKNWTTQYAGTVTDVSGNGHTGTFVSQDRTVADAPGKIGQGWNSQVINGRMSFSGFSVGPAFTYSQWIYYTPGGGCLICNGGGEGIHVLDWTINFWYSGAYHYTSFALPQNAWSHLVVMSDSSGNVHYYVNGVLQADVQTGFSSVSFASLGSTGSGANAYGTYDDVRIYNRDLSPTEVALLYKLGETKMNSAVSQPQGTGRLDSGLAGYWKLDDNSGSTAVDSSTNGNTGTLTNGPTWTTGQIGGAVDFDGANDYITLTSTTATKVASGEDFSVSGWFNRDTFTGVHPIFVNKNTVTSAGDKGYGVYIDGTTDKLTLAIADLDTDTYKLESASTFTATGWHHFTVVWNHVSASEIKLYIDGVAESTTATGTFANIGDFSGPATTKIGADSNAGVFFDGKLDEIRLYKRPLSADEVSQLYRLTSPTGVDTGLKGYWSFNGQDMNGTTAFDRSGGGNNGTLTNGPTKVPGKIGQALSFDGTDDYVVAASTPSLGTTYTVSAWVRPTTVNANRAFVSYRSTSSATPIILQLDQNSTDVRFIVRDDAGNIATSTYAGVLVIGQWAYVVGIRNGNNVTVYVNGAEATVATATIGTITANSLNIGASTAGSTTRSIVFSGVLDEARIYSRVLSAAEIKSLYDASESDKLNSSVSQPQGTGRLDSGLAGYWPLDNGSGTSATDSSTNGNTGTLTNGPTWTTGQIGGAVDFDGTDDYINVTGSPLNVQNVSYWIKPTANKYSLSLSQSKRYFLNNGLYNGSNTSTRYINGSFARGESLGSELVYNGTMTSASSDNDWYLYVDEGIGASATLSTTSSSPYAGSYSLDINIINDGNSAGSIGLNNTYNTFSTTSGTLYKAQFAVKGSTNFSGAVSSVYLNNSPWTAASPQYTVDITTNWVLHTYYFYAERTGTTDNRINFSFGNIGTGHIYIDNISVRPVSSIGDVTNNSWNFVSVNLDSAVSADAISFAKVASRYLGGSIDEIRFYGRALSADEISQLYRVTSPTSVDTSLKGYWSFNGKDLSGTTAFDRSGGGNNGTLTNGPARSEGKIGQGLSFDGSNDYVDVPYANLDFERTDTFSLSAWVKLTSSSLYQTVFGRIPSVSGASRGMAFVYTPTTTIFGGAKSMTAWLMNAGTTNGIVVTSPDNSMSINIWKHVILTYSGNSNASGVKIYIDGVNQTLTTKSDTLSATIKPGVYNWRIGDDYTGDYAQGGIDEVRIYNRVLSAAEVASLYNQGR